MTKDYKEVERVVKEFVGTWLPNGREADQALMESELNTLLTSYGNARELEGEKKAVEEFENKRDDDSCECDNCHRWRKYRKNKLSYFDHIAKVKSELK